MSLLSKVSLAVPPLFSPSERTMEHQAGPYLRGPIPWSGLRQAILLGHGAVSVALALWHLRALKGSTSFAASHRSLCGITGLSEKVVREGLRRLAGSGLIAIETRPGMNSRYSLSGWSDALPQAG